MKTKKSKKEEGENGILKNTEIKEEVKTDSSQQNEGESLDDEFKAFEERTSTFTPEIEETVQPAKETKEKASGETVNAQPIVNTIDSNIAKQMKQRMFVGFCCLLLSNLSTFILNMIRGSHVPSKLMRLEDDEIDEILEMVNASPEIMEFINKLPSSVIMTLSIGYMMYEKHDALVDDYKNEPKKKIVKEITEEKEEK